jgi:hypothetical protein
MSAIIETFPLGFPFRTFDPFLFCVHHDDHYPKGNAQLGPDVSLAGRNLGQDFTLKDGFRMYHGRVVPGFPRHPHRGFETVTLVRKGRIDHSDSMGAKARFGGGDVQWMTAGHGIEHCEMFPMLNRDAGNHVELFQIWLNLPARSKHVPPHFTMLWSDTLPTVVHHDDADRAVQIDAVAGDLAGGPIPAPPPSSWAADPENHVTIATLRFAEGARYTLPATVAGLNRTLYAFQPGSFTIDGQTVRQGTGVRLRSDADVVIENGGAFNELLMLQGRPIAEPVVQYGPFVMNTEAEIREAMADYRAGEFGRWPWDGNDPVHGPEADRFALHADGKEERPA